MTLEEARENIGELVVYDSGHHREDGIITSVNDTFVFVRYGIAQNGKATLPQQLELLA